ncbi:hypothetical protein C8R46DRAFT_1235211 [Mycena filopes]|nr:hypothetical protein C8R46DRAFT_1235211 [Mycena filopes]
MLAHLAADRIRVAELEAQILHLQNCLRDLELEKHLTQDRLDSYYYPVLALPNEITSEIFKHFLPVFPFHTALTGPCSPTVLTHICRKWRDIALSTPTLWSAISLKAVRLPFALAVEIADLWLTRSRSCPLSINIDCRSDVSTFLPRIFEEAARVEELGLEITSFDLVPTSRSMPMLRCLHLHIRVDQHSPLPPTPLPLFSDTPQLLRSVVLNHIAAFHIQLPWAQLTSVCICPLFPGQCVPVLRQAPNLLHCQLVFKSNGSVLAELTLPVLESLQLYDDGGLADSGIMDLDNLTVPALRDLTISESFLGEDPIDVLTRFITKSHCKLQEVCILDVEYPGIYRAAFPLIQFTLHLPGVPDCTPTCRFHPRF